MSHAVSTERKPELLMCILSYLGIFALIPYFVRKDDQYIQWHAKQGLLFAAVMIVLSIVLAVLSMLPAIGVIAGIGSTVVSLVSLVVSIYCMVQAYSGKYWRIPVLGSLVS